MQLSDVDSVANLVCSACQGHFSLVAMDDTLSRTWHEDKRLGDFLLVEAVGVGAYGIVWKAARHAIRPHGGHQGASQCQPER